MARSAPVTRRVAAEDLPPHYKWLALSNTTLGMIMAAINSSITLIALPDIFKGIRLNPLLPSSTGYLLWMLMGFMVVTAVLVVTLGRIGDMYGRVRIYNMGFAVFTAFSILLSVTWMTGPGGALWLIGMRIGQGIGAACLMANSTAILTDAFPETERGLAIGINAIALVVGSFVGLILGGLLGPVSWRLVFLVSVPFGLFGTVWAYLKLRDQGVRKPAPIDWWGNVTFAAGLVAVLAGITYGIMPYGSHVMGWTNPKVLGALIGGGVLLVVFAVIETKVAHPMFRLSLFRIRAFTGGNFAGFLGALGRGGLMFMLIIWLQGIWLPLHGYDFAQTPLWAGIYMLPLTGGMLVAAPVSGWLSDRFGARPFATGGMLVTAAGFVALTVLPIVFNYLVFAVVLFVMGVAMGIFAAPNRAGIMNSLPPDQRGSGAGVANTFQNSAQVLSIGIFFTLIIIGLSSRLPGALFKGLTAQGVPPAAATRVSHLPPVGSLFAAFLGYNPIQQLLGPSASHLPAAKLHYLTGHSFFPHLISGAFANGLHEAFYFAATACVLAAGASWLRGKKYVHGMTVPDQTVVAEQVLPAVGAGPVPAGAGERAGAGRAVGGADGDGEDVAFSSPGRREAAG